MALEHSIVRRLRRKRILSSTERKVNSGTKSTAQTEIKAGKHGKWNIAEGRQVES